MIIAEPTLFCLNRRAHQRAEQLEITARDATDQPSASNPVDRPNFAPPPVSESEVLTIVPPATAEQAPCVILIAVPSASTDVSTVSPDEAAELGRYESHSISRSIHMITESQSVSQSVNVR